MIVHTVGLHANPETLIGRVRHEAQTAYGWEGLHILDQMHADVFGRTDRDGNRKPYPFHEVVTDLVALGFDMRDWTGRNIKSVLPFDPTDRALVKLVFASRTSAATATATVKVAGPAVEAFVADMEQSGLWLLVRMETVR